MMVKVLFFGYCVGVASSRRIAQRLHEDIAFRVLAANNTPDFRTISDFRKEHLAELSGLFMQVLTLCQRAGLVKLGHVALDGTKIRANASKHRAMSYRRMKEKEAQLAEEVEELLNRAEEVDAEEDRRYGQDKRGDELPQELAFREGRLEKIREAMAALEAEAQAAAEQAETEGRKHPGVPEDRSQRNFTDAESRIMPAPGGRDFVQAYNCQAVVDSANQVIVAARATNEISDKQQAVTMMEETIDNVGAVPREVSADAGYYSTKAVVRYMRWVWSRSLHRIRPATAGCRPRLPAVAYPVGCLPGIGCDGSCRSGVVVSDTLFEWGRLSRYSVSSNRAGASDSSCCGDWRR